MLPTIDRSLIYLKELGYFSVCRTKLAEIDCLPNVFGLERRWTTAGHRLILRAAWRFKPHNRIPGLVIEPAPIPINEISQPVVIHYLPNSKVSPPIKRTNSNEMRVWDLNPPH